MAELTSIVSIMLLHFIFLLISCNTILSQTIVRSLPGFAGPLPFKLETGYIGVGDKDDVQLFYYFVESESNPKNDPLILWLAGGPGCSTLRAFFYEIGPFIFNYANSIGNKPTLELNPYSWTKVANIIFLDQPAGTGYSYATNPGAYKSSDTASATLVYEFLKNWLNVHPKFLNNPLYVCGVSYIGMVIPIIVQNIYNGNEAGQYPPLNIKGYMLGNPLTDKKSDINSRVPYANRVALISDEIYQSAKTNCVEEYIDVNPNNILCEDDLDLVNKCTEKINLPDILEPLCSTLNHRRNLFEWEKNSFEEKNTNLIKLPSANSSFWCRGYTYVFSSIWANDKAVQEALNVRQDTVEEWVQCNATFEYAANLEAVQSYVFNVPSTVEYHRNLMEKKCRALIFSGDQDMRVPHIGTEKWIHSLNLTVDNLWTPWFVEGQIAGYTVSYSHNDYSLTYATLKGAGHTGPEYKPKECLSMVARWFAYYSL